MSAPSGRLLVVEDDPVIQGSIGEMLHHWGYSCDTCGDGALAWEYLQRNPYDLVLLDLHLPNVDGMELCSRLRSSEIHQPLVMMLTARDTSLDNIEGLDRGADDYMVKPFEPTMLRARIAALLRRSVRPLQRQLSWGLLQLSADLQDATYAGRELPLTSKEHQVLVELIKAYGQVCTKQHLLDTAWHRSHVALDELRTEDSLKTHMKNLRAKLTAAGAPRDLIQTVYGLGYRLNADHAS
jgi:DNA-binding response OmpR family regulator